MLPRALLPCCVAALVSLAVPALAAEPAPNLSAELARVRAAQDDLDHRLDVLEKAVDDLAWTLKLDDVAEVEKWRIAGPPPAKPRDPDDPALKNPVKFYLYTFIPKARRAGEKLPVLVLPHGGVHGDFRSNYSHIVREMLEQGYAVVAPEYRGSTGYGKEFHDLIDYGGREVDDVRAATRWALERFDFLDGERVGLVGWSHGGLIVLLEAARHPKDYRAVFAGVPVSDLVQRMGYSDEGYRKLFSDPAHLGKSARADVAEYRKRSPVWNVKTLDVPLLVHTNTNDEDVYFTEVEHLAQALKAAGKPFEYRVFEDAPGGHHMDRIDTLLAVKARADVYRFLAKHLRPARPPR
jgi:dipeptidyl aminopeptidase/acylaminoacyl peptidase